MSIVYSLNKEAKSLSKEIISRYHQHLKGIEIAYIFRDAGKKAKPKPGFKEWARAQKAPERFKLLMEPKPVFVITFDYRVWKHLKDKQKKALCHHELCHCFYHQGKKKATMLHHDLEEFKEVFKIYGFWSDGIKEFIEAGKHIK